MNFYLDFEATQFSERIISIGCVSENGNEFDTLVKPPKGDKVNKFITDLTGIEQWMVDEADDADACFLALREFIREESHGEETFFFVYGNADCHFIERTVAKMIDPEARKFTRKLGASLIDFSLNTNRFFGMSGISLKNAVSYFRQEEVKQTHRAIDDAELLRELVYMVNFYDMPEFDDNILEFATTRTGKPKAKKETIKLDGASSDLVKTNDGMVMPALAFPHEFEGITQWCDIPMDWYPKGTLLRVDNRGKVERPFTCLENACVAIKAKHGDSSNTSIKKNILTAINNKTKCYGKYWVVA